MSKRKTAVVEQAKQPRAVLTNLEQAEAACKATVNVSAKPYDGVAYADQNGQAVTFEAAERMSFTQILTAAPEQAERVLAMATIQYDALRKGARTYMERAIAHAFWLYALLVRLTGLNILSWHSQDGIAKRIGGRLHKNAYYIAHLVRGCVDSQFPNWERHLDPAIKRAPYKWSIGMAGTAGQLLEYATNELNLAVKREELSKQEVAKLRGIPLTEEQFGLNGTIAKRVFAALALKDVDGDDIPGKDVNEQVKNAAATLKNTLAFIGLTEEMRNDRIFAALGTGQDMDEKARHLRAFLDSNPELAEAFNKVSAQ